MTNKQTESHCAPSNCSRHFEVCDCKSMCLLRYGAEIRKRQEEVGSATGLYEKDEHTYAGYGSNVGAPVVL